ncbi:MAG: extracellular solute-binding protein, partial [Oscillospiraceae bacterium]|nr:extracellular solute-binding protein [Oscillospiraceae bacterium]
MKKIIAFMIIFAFISAILISCGDNNTDGNNTGGDDVPGQDAPGLGGEDEGNPAEAKILPDLPEDVRYDGQTFTFLAHKQDTPGWDWVESDPRELVAEEENSEPINDAVYARNMAIREKYGIEIAMFADSAEDSIIRRVVNAGDSTYDAVLIYNNNVPGVVTGGALAEVSTLPYIDLSKPWWDPGVNGMSIANKQFLLAGDLLILDNEATNAIIFNKDLMATLGMELPYGLVNEGKWTFDAMLEMTKDVEMDLNGDGVLNYADDRFSFMVFNDTLQAFLVAGGGQFSSKDANDIPYMSFADEKSLAVLDKAMDLMYTNSNQGVFNVQSVDAGSGNVTWMRAYYDTFFEDRALFMWIRMRVVEVFRGMESN